MPTIDEELIIPFTIGEPGAAIPSALAPETPHFKFPFGRGADGQVGVVEQGSQAHVLGCCNVIALCPIGARPERPEFGWRFPYMRMLPIDPTELQQAIERFEPRAQPTVKELNRAVRVALGIGDVILNIGVPAADPTGSGRGEND